MNKIKFDKTMEEVKLDMETRHDLLVIDVREEDEYAQGHIPGALWKPLRTLKEHTQELRAIHKDIYVYCRSGQRSRAACRILKEEGITNVYNIGGILQWTYDVNKGMEA